MTSLTLHLRSRLIRSQPTIRTITSSNSTNSIIAKSIMTSSIMKDIGSYISFNVAHILGWKKDPSGKGQDTNVPSLSTYSNNSYNSSGHSIHCYNGVDSIWNSNHILMEYNTMDCETEGDAMVMEEDFSTWLISTLKRRKKKMNKHKLQKRRKRERLSGNKK